MENEEKPVPDTDAMNSSATKKNQKRKSENSSDRSPSPSRRELNSGDVVDAASRLSDAYISSAAQSTQKAKYSRTSPETDARTTQSSDVKAQGDREGNEADKDDAESVDSMPGLLDPNQLNQIAASEDSEIRVRIRRRHPAGLRISTSDEEEGPRAEDLPDLISPDDSSDHTMEVSDDDEEEEEDEGQDDRNSENPILWHTPADPHDLIAPLPPLQPAESLPALLLWKELDTFPSAALMRQKLCSHRDLVQRMGLYATLDFHQGCVNSLNFNPAGTLLASGSDDLKVGVWDWMSKKLRYSFSSGHVANVFQTKFLPMSNDSLIVTASRDGAVRLAELSLAGGPPKTRKLCGHNGACHKIDVRADAQFHVLTSGEDAVVNYVDYREARARKCLIVRDGKNAKVPLYSVMSNPLKAHEFVVSGCDKYVRVFDMRKLDSDPSDCKPLLSLCPPILHDKAGSLSVSSAVYNYNGSEILTTYNDFHIFLFKNCADEQVATVDLNHYEGHRNNQTVKGVNFYGSKSEYVVSGSDCGRVFFWDKESGKIVHYLMADEVGAVNVLEPHPRDPYFATSGLEHTAKIWAPLNEGPADLEELIPVIDKNSNERKRDVRMMRNHSAREERFFMMLMNHIARRGNRADRENAEEENAEEEVEPEEHDSDEDDVQVGRVRCGTN